MSGETLRLFFAVALAQDLRDAAAQIQENLRRAGGRVKWVEPDNLHITLKFLGDTPARMAARLSAIAGQVAGRHEPFELSFAGVGAFPRPEQPRTVWIGVDAGGPALEALARDLDETLADSGIAEGERRPFRAHLTIGRNKSPGEAQDLAQAINEARRTVLGIMSITDFSLIRSKLTRQGPIYTPVGSFSL